jgi:hypothetical protein
MTKPTLLSDLYNFIRGSRRVDVAALRARFPHEFSAHGPTVEPGIASRSLNEALCILLGKGLVHITPRGKLVHGSAWRALQQVRLERRSLQSPEVEAN